MTTSTDLRDLIVKDEVRELMAQYVYLADHKQFGDVAALFTPTATFAIHDVHGDLVLKLHGPAEIEDVITRGVGTSTAVHHLFSSVTNVIDEEHATSVVNMEDIIGAPGDPGADDPLLVDRPFRTMHGYGHYRGEFVKIDGQWRIAAFVQTRIRVDTES